MTQTTSRPAVDGPAAESSESSEPSEPAGDGYRRVDADTAALLPGWTEDLGYPADVDEVLAALVRHRAPTWVLQRLSRLPVSTTLDSPEHLLAALHEVA